MKNIVGNLKNEMERSGYRFRIVSIKHLPEVQDAVARLVRQGLVNRGLSENWHFYLDTCDALPEAASIIIVAMPQAITRIRFLWQGIDYPAELSPGTRVDDFNIVELLKNALEEAGYTVTKARLALKTLAVRSGLAEYGKNNIVYVTGMGSFCRLVAFYTDFPCEEDSWGQYRAMEICTDCFRCRNNCPTGSISADRFLIHAENCLGFLNQKQPDFPYWSRLQPDWHNALVGCMRCQFICPANEPYVENITDGPSFSEQETGMILDKTPLDALLPETRQKLDNIADAIYPLLSVNLIDLIEKQGNMRSL